MIKCYKTMAYDIYIELKNSAEYLNSSIYVDDYDIYINKDSERCVECLEIINRYCLLKKLDAKYLLKSDNTQITDENKTKIKDNMNKVVAHLINNISLYFN